MLLRKLADNGQSILCTIHQPSFQLFAMFDRLLLLGNGGKTLYFGDIGPNASTLIHYFESNGAPQCQPGENPAEWIINVTTKQVESKICRESAAHGDWADKWSNSQQRHSMLSHLDDLKTTHSKIPQPVQAGTVYATSIIQQVVILSKRTFIEQWRSPAFLMVKIVVFTGTVSFYSSVLFHSRKTLQSFNLYSRPSLTGSLFSTSLSACKALPASFFLSSFPPICSATSSKWRSPLFTKEESYSRLVKATQKHIPGLASWSLTLPSKYSGRPLSELLCLWLGIIRLVLVATEILTLELQSVGHSHLSSSGFSCCGLVPCLRLWPWGYKSRKWRCKWVSYYTGWLLSFAGRVLLFFFYFHKRLLHPIAC